MILLLRHGETYDAVMGRATDWLHSQSPEPTPQHAVYRLQNGQIDRFDVEPVE